MWHCGTDICISSVYNHKPPKTVHSSFAVPLTVNRNIKQHILNSNTHSALQCVCQQAVYSSCHHTALQCACQQAVYSSCHHTALQCVCQQRSLQFLTTYCITVCVPARLSAVPVTILHYRLCASRLSAVPVTILHYSVCASNALCSSCHHTALQCVCQQGCLQFLSPYC